jgi:hypothetical protein
MKFFLSLQQLGQAPEMWLRRVGYTFLPGRGTQQDSFARRLSRDFYPRFHVYFTTVNDSYGQKIINFNLHLDQKKPGYAGYSRHNAEYDGEAVEGEVQRLKNLLNAI